MTAITWEYEECSGGERSKRGARGRMVKRLGHRKNRGRFCWALLMAGSRLQPMDKGVPADVIKEKKGGAAGCGKG